jgi:hypothetical protein
MVTITIIVIVMEQYVGHSIVTRSESSVEVFMNMIVEFIVVDQARSMI